MMLFGMKIQYFERTRYVPFTVPFPDFVYFKQEVFRAFPLLTREQKQTIYFTWEDDDEDEIIVRRDIEFNYALQSFASNKRKPKFAICFEDGVNSFEDQTENHCDAGQGRKRQCLNVNSVIPVIDF